MNFGDIFSLAFRSVRSNKLRTGITIAIIAFGIMALVGIITAIKAMNQKFTESFSTMGANAFTVRYKERNIRIGGGGNNSDIKLTKKGARKEKKSNLGKIITKEEAELFVKRFDFPSTKSISIFGNRNNIISYRSRKTSPNVMMFGGDENYLVLNGFNVQAGRNINKMDVSTGRNVCLIGYDVAKKLFKEGIERAVNAVVRINSIPYRVLGVLESRGSSFGFSRDNVIITTYENIDRNFPSNFSYVVAVMANDLRVVTEAMGEAEGSFRAIRKLNTTEDNNFVIDRSDSVAEKAMNSLRFLTISATVIGLITLIGAAIGLMNIMLVSVSERTREVGLVKAIGGKRKLVSRQFLLEAVIISVLGAIFGIVLGILVGNIFSVVLNTGFVVPWGWIFYGIIICTIVGLLAGLYPALKAGKLNPIEALRYE
ncbi:MAG: ABC transporter permease [Chitinophagaceae bacterium]|nr:ABC transporter permease [Chitinophagaceae bacterium]MBK8953620.1 ABC transporter permease [Chitinophagaceae bacterium]